MKKLILLFLFTTCNALIAVSQSFGDNMELVNLGRKVNTGYHEAGPVISPDGSTLYFFVHNHPENNYGKEGSQDVWFVEKGEDGSWGEAKHLDKPFNIHRSNQVFGVLGDGNLLFVRGGDRKNSKGFSFIRKQGSGWSNPVEVEVEDFKKMNQGKFYGATISTDGNYIILYFSEREHSRFSDLYLSKRKDDGNFSKPVKINGLNTGRDEFAPFLAPDDKTLYFSSSRKDVGIGSADIYVTRRLDDTWTKWSEPENVGRPVNTRAFDAYMCVDKDKNVFVTQSGRTIDGGNLDIFALEQRQLNIRLIGMVMDEESRQMVNGEIRFISDKGETDTLWTNENNGTYETHVKAKTTYEVEVVADGYETLKTSLAVGKVQKDTTIVRDFALKANERAVMLAGTLFNGQTLEPVRGRIVMDSPAGNGKEIEIKTNSQGYFEKELEVEGWYMLTGLAEGYMNASDSIINNGEKTFIQKDLYLDPVEVGITVRLDNIFFDFDKTTLKPESYAELNKVLNFLESNPKVEIEIAGHTDNKGSDDYNVQLSHGRAQAVVEYLISQGINFDRIVAQGYGESVPVASNDTDKGRAINRRVEFTVLSK
jgi:OOP family OmpA-OmpF porin